MKVDNLGIRAEFPNRQTTFSLQFPQKAESQDKINQPDLFSD